MSLRYFLGKGTAYSRMGSSRIPSMLSLSLTHTHTLALSLSHTHTRSLSLSLSRGCMSAMCSEVNARGPFC